MQSPLSRLSTLSVAAAAVALATGAGFAQVDGKVGQYSNATISNSVVEPEKIEVTDNEELAGLISAPDGFTVDVYARDLVNPRMLAVSDAGILYATRRSVGDVVMLKDENGDGSADDVQTVASRPDLHGIAFDGNRVFLATVNHVYAAEVREDGTFSELTRIIGDLPDGGQHPNRTLAIGPDDKLYISVGSTCNACPETNPESATLLRAEKDGSYRTIFATGLRNTIGFGWHPETGALYGMDHGIDWLGDEEQVEELNLIEKGKKYGWPYVYGMSKINPGHDPEGMTPEQWARLSTEPVLGYTAHSAPMQMAFYEGGMFPESYRGDAFVAMRGSWNRRPPSGYQVLRVRFEDGKPAGFEHFLEGFLIRREDGSYGYLGRLAGIAVGPDGALFVSDDSNGVIYRVSHEGGTSGEAAATSSDRPDTVPEPRDSEIALNLVQASTDTGIEVTAPFEDGGTIPPVHAAEGDNISPRLEWSGAPDGTRSFAIIMDDPDAGAPKPFTHWIAYDIPADVTSLREGMPTSGTIPEPQGMKQGTNSRGSIGYFGPKPPVGDPPHAYHFQVFAFDTETLDVNPSATREEVLQAMEGHVLAKGEVVGRFQRSENTGSQ